MQKTIWAAFLVGIVTLASPAFADIYKYIDENGQKRWTDDLSQVPKEQRPAILRKATEDAKAIPGDTQFEPAATDPAGPVSESRAALPATAHSVPAGDLSRDALLAEKADLDSQYNLLMQERKKLEYRLRQELGAAAREQLNQQVAEFNVKTEQFESRLNRFYNKVDQYNQHNRTAEAKAAQ
ncbi:MAG: hypothetical protein PVG51_13015 [Desulfosarcina sp.]|jgi:hypothetical protein